MAQQAKYLTVVAVALGIVFFCLREATTVSEDTRPIAVATKPIPEGYWTIYTATTADGEKIDVEIVARDPDGTLIRLEPAVIQMAKYRINRVVRRLTHKDAASVEGQKFINEEIGRVILEYRAMQARAKKSSSEGAMPPPQTKS